VPSGGSRGSSTFGGRDIARRERDRAETQTRLAASRYLAVQAGLRSDTEPDLGMLLSVAAARMDNNAEARGSLFEQVQSRRDVSGLLVGHDTEVTAVANQTVLGELDAAAWPRRLCAIVGRTLTRSEWEQFLPQVEYCDICS
jgi:hypothetical protein